jgi:GDP-L-fucose synthase
MNKDSKIYVAGHTGLLGTALIKKLGESGFSNIITRPRSRLDLTNKKVVDEFFKDNELEYVFLAAGKTGGIMANKTYPAEFLHVNIAIQDNVFEAAQNYEVKHLTFYGSSCIYPKYSPQPIKEDYLFTGKIEETNEAYAIAKIAGIVSCKSYNTQYNTNRFIALVPNSMYGPNDNFDLNSSHVLSALIRKFHDAKERKEKKVELWGSGNPRREFIFSEDIADASIFAMENADKLKNKHYNIGIGVDYSIKELATMAASVIGYEDNIIWDTTKPDGAPQKLLDCSSFFELGWKPSMPLKNGLQITYDWFVKNYGNKGAQHER